MRITKLEKNNQNFIISIEGASAIITSILYKYSRVDSSNVYHYLVPDFHDKDGNIHEYNQILKEKYQIYTNYLFYTYSNLIGAGIPEKEVIPIRKGI